ncbi:MAG: hypothetical protein AAF378_10715 [Cyanobacteria bacterium P01_A01_bin.84]
MSCFPAWRFSTGFGALAGISITARYNKFFPIFNRIYKKVAQAYPKIEFVDYWNTLVANGKFVPVAADSSGRRGRVRYNDGLHPT